MNTKLLRQKILDLAIRGKLTEQKKSDGTTRDLLASIAASSACHAELVSASPSSSAKKNSKATERSVILSKRSASKDLAKEIIPLNKDEAPFEIPENWEWVRLGDVAYIASGSTPSKDCFVDEGVPYLKMYNLRNQQIDFDYKPQFVKREIHEGKLARSRTKPYDVIMNIVGPPLGKIALIPESLPECNFNQAAVLIRAHYETRLMNQYIRFYLMQMGEINSINTKGTAGQENLSLSQTQNMRLPLPPLAEQKRIVEAIESAFAEITAIENNQELLKKHIKQGRQKILELAIRGKLTEQKESDGTTKDLLASIATASACHAELVSASPSSSAKKNSKATERSVILSKRNASKDLAKEIIPLNKDEAPFEIPENWEWVRLGDVASDFQYGSSEKSEPEGKVAVLRMSNINRMGQVVYDDLVYTSTESEIAKYTLDVGDVLFNRTNSPEWVGKTALYRGDIPAIYAGYIIRIKPKFLPEYLNYLMCSKYERDWAYEVKTDGVHQSNINAQKLMAFAVPLPPLAEQKRIVEAIESAFAEITAIENNQELLKKHIKQGRQKILELAIRGKLTEQKESDGTTKDLLASIATASACHAELVSASPSSSAKKNSKATERSVILSKRNASKDLAKEIIPLNKDEAPFEIPENWEWVRLGDVCTINQSNQLEDDLDVAFVPMTNVAPGYANTFKQDVRKWGEIKKGFTHFANGDIAVAKITPCFENRKSVLFKDLKNGYGAGTTELHILRPSIELNRLFLLWFVKTDFFIQHGIGNFSGAVGQQRVGKDVIANIAFPLPPLAEQQRIVEAIESAFAEFDAMEKL